jgi:endonuclease/exonuclease/phosphatase family metal-dependent hydrolase
MHIRFATWNIGCGAKGFHGHNPLGLANALIEHEIDVCVLQEVDAFAKRSNFVDFPSVLKGATGFNSAYCVSVNFPSEQVLMPREYGNLLLSKYPILHVETVILEHDITLPHRHPAEIERRTGVLVQVDADGFKPWFVGTHLAYSPDLIPSPVRQGQINSLIGAIERLIPAKEPVVIGGDFNTGFCSQEIAALSSRFEPITQDIRPTWPIGGKTQGQAAPLIAIDHIFGRGFVEARSTVVDYPELTDHSLVIADLTFYINKPH